ncbi:flagellar hook-length control protein FliK [Paenibacillus rhizophilus]|uniref:Flagellar hook-length control protein FliK n=1 Tax=Paenibacillus rhizophilus TaxID=1850366 RepID=A0A3N9PCA7_9BACL|nr:flagellar hook-length control protein FliK [Paenibacillus rhizophilus]RQW13130.1 flagellar hook-length control protein FliK [Paenibacillus rhizophilus]
MSLVFQMISSGKGLNAKTTASPGTAGAAGAGNGMFSSTLIQSMAGSTSELAVASQSDAAAATLQNLLITALSNHTGEDGETADLSGKKLLDELLPELSKLDEQIESDPALLAALQGWLVQVSALLSGNEMKESPDQTALTPLAQNPATARFAVQDELNNLAALIQQASGSGDEASAGKALALLNSFASMIEPYTGTVDSSVSGTAAAAMPSGIKGVDKLQGPRTSKTGDVNVGVGLSKAADAVSNKPDSSGQIDTASLDTQAASGNPLSLKLPLASAEINKEHSTANEGTVTDKAAEQDSSQGDSNVITAGQLSLRDGITATPKAEISQVPVHKFAEEMTGFITGKLEIVKKGGVAEATLSLFPENLGQVDVKITMHNGHVVAQFLAEHSGARDLLENQMSQLRAALQSQGLQVEKLEVSQNNTPLQSQLFQEGRHSGAGSQGSDRRSKERKDSSDDAVLAAELDGEWKDWLANERQNTRNPASQFSAEA